MLFLNSLDISAKSICWANYLKLVSILLRFRIHSQLRHKVNIKHLFGIILGEIELNFISNSYVLKQNNLSGLVSQAWDSRMCENRPF